MRTAFVVLFFCSSLGAHLATQSDVLQRIRAHNLIKEHLRAAELAHEAITSSPADAKLYAAYVESLAKGDYEKEALEALAAFRSLFPKEKDVSLMEEVAWAVMRNGAKASSSATQRVALLGATLTQDAAAIDFLLQGLISKNRHMRKLALQLLPQLRDAPLQAALLQLLRFEGGWDVKLHAMLAAGQLQMRELLPDLERVIGSVKTSDQERLAAIGAVVEMLEEIDPAHLQFLATHKRAGLRQLACEAVAHLDLKEQVGVITPLLNDPIPSVRTEALVTLGLLRVEGIENQVRPLLLDAEPTVAITAAWLMTLLVPEEGMRALAAHLTSRNRELAAAALAHTGTYGLPLSLRMLKEHSDPVVRANIALGLMGQQVELERSADTLYALLIDQDKRWMWSLSHPLFHPLAKSTVRRGQGGGPEVVDQLTRLELLGKLAVARYSGALEAIRAFLSQRNWGISGVAAITLLEEGDEAAIELVRTLLTDPEPKVRAQAAIALAIWGKDPSATATLQALYPSADRRLKIILLEGMGHVAASEAIPFLLAALEEPFPTLRIIAASSLIQCLNG